MDAWAVLAWARNEEPAATTVQQLLDDAAEGQRVLSMSMINLGEVYYGLMRKHGTGTANQFRDQFQTAHVQFMSATDERIWQAAALKGRYDVSYADAFAAALALELKAMLATGDPELTAIEKGEGLRIRWLSRRD